MKMEYESIHKMWALKMFLNNYVITILVINTDRFMLDIKKEQKLVFVQKVTEMAKSVGFTVCFTVQSAQLYFMLFLFYEIFYYNKQGYNNNYNELL